MEFAIATNALGKTYRLFPAVRNLNLQIPYGEIYALLGPNGAGKTTIVRMLLGNIHPSTGEAMLLGKPIGDVTTRRRIGFLPEKYSLHDFLTATELLKLHGNLVGMPREVMHRRIPEVLERVGLLDCAHRRIHDFSKGMQQRIGFGQAILADPDLVILDEPTSALDPIGRRDVRDLILELRSKGKTIVVNSHLLSEIELACDRLAILHKGEIVIQGKLSELLATSSLVEIEVAEMNDAAMVAIRRIVAKLKMERVPVTRFTVWIKCEEDISELAQALVGNGVKLKALVPRRETLEELFVRVIESQ